VELEDMGVEKTRQRHAHMYQPTFGVPLRRLLRELHIPPGKVLVDLGCGKGKVLLVASEFGFREVRGVEFSPILCEVARRNCSLYQAKRKKISNLSIIHADVTDYRIRDDEDIFFLFNPFDDFILEQVLQNIASSLQRHNRKIWIIYRNAVHRDSVEELLQPSSVRSFTFWGLDFVVFEIE
jgi:SAM-dependent methyltransferase